jgi:hypothetical protein
MVTLGVICATISSANANTKVHKTFKQKYFTLYYLIRLLNLNIKEQNPSFLKINRRVKMLEV